MSLSLLCSEKLFDAIELEPRPGAAPLRLRLDVWADFRPSGSLSVLRLAASVHRSIPAVVGNAFSDVETFRDAYSDATTEGIEVTVSGSVLGVRFLFVRPRPLDRMQRMRTLTALVLASLALGCVQTRTYQVSVTNHTDTPITFGIVKHGDPYELNGPRRSRRIERRARQPRIVGHPPGKTAVSDQIKGRFNRKKRWRSSGCIRVSSTRPE